MQDASARLSLPFIQPSQAQKHVTHNAAVATLDALVQMVVAGFDAVSPPAIVTDGEIWALGAAPTDAWAGQADMLAVWENGGWRFIAPQVGWVAVGASDLTARIWTGALWQAQGAGALNQLPGVGIGTDYDATNALAVAGEATLFTHAGAGHQLKLNKATLTDTASLLFQTGFGGRAEMGTAGTDAFEIKVSADGTAWRTALRLGAEALDDLDGTGIPPGFYHTGAGTLGTFPTAQKFGQLLMIRQGVNDAVQMFWNVAEDAAFQRRFRASAGGWQPWRKGWDSANTTVDANGFVKEASPILRLADDGITEPVEPVGATFARVDVGQYTVSGVAPLADAGWQIEVPQDHNGNRLVFVETAYDATAQVLSVHTSAVVWDAQTGTWAGGAPLDIPAGRWIDLRFSEAESVEPLA